MDLGPLFAASVALGGTRTCRDSPIWRIVSFLDLRVL
jgi:hypothetical protein